MKKSRRRKIECVCFICGDTFIDYLDRRMRKPDLSCCKECETKFNELTEKDFYSILQHQLSEEKELN